MCLLYAITPPSSFPRSEINTNPPLHYLVHDLRRRRRQQGPHLLKSKRIRYICFVSSSWSAMAEESTPLKKITFFFFSHRWLSSFKSSRCLRRVKWTGNGALVRELMNAREDVLRRGQDAPAGAEETEARRHRGCPRRRQLVGNRCWYWDVMGR